MFNTPATTQTARKVHQCSWCAKAIKAGESYERWASYVDGSCTTNKMHLACVPICNEACSEGDGTYIPGEGAWDWMP